MNLQNPSSLLAYILLLLMGVAWGLAVSTSKLAIISGGHPIGIALWQVIISGSLLSFVGLVKRRPSIPRLNVIGFSLFCGACGVAFPAYALFQAAYYLPAGIVAIAFASMPVFTYLLSIIFRIEQGHRIRWLGVLVGLMAMALIILPKHALPNSDHVPWVILTLFASLSMSIENCYAGGMRPTGISSVQLSCGRQLGAVVFLLPFAFLTETLPPIFEPWGIMHWSATLTGLLSGFCFTVLLYVINTSGPVFASQCAYLITVFGVIWGLIIFDETHSYYIWGALGMILISCALVRPRETEGGKMKSSSRVVGSEP